MERTLAYTVGYEGVAPRAPQFAGVQGEHGVTGLVFTLEEDLAAQVEAEQLVWDRVVYRVDFTDAAVSITAVDWKTVIGTAALAGVMSILTSLAGLPEARL